MAYTTYTTEAIVCGSRASNTSDKSYLLFTQAAGMLWATARSVREERSRQRCALQDFSLVRLSLVKGKSGWRVGSVEALSNPFLAARHRAGRHGVTSVIKLLRRFVSGEEPLHTVYEDIRHTLEVVTAQSDPPEVVRILQVLELRTLHTLGYIAVPKDLALMVGSESAAAALARYTPQKVALTERLLEQAGRVSHL